MLVVNGTNDEAWFSSFSGKVVVTGSNVAKGMAVVDGMEKGTDEPFSIPKGMAVGGVESNVAEKVVIKGTDNGATVDAG